MDTTSENKADRLRGRVEEIYRSDSRRVFATLIRLLGDFDLAEDALHNAFAAALEQWPKAGVPANPRAWLVSVGRFKAIDALRKRARFDAALGELADRLDSDAGDPATNDGEEVEDDRLRLIFTCCHPALSPEAQAALTLREVCGLTTEDIARLPSLPADAGPAHRARQGESPTSCHRGPSCPSGWTACCAWSTSFSTGGIQPRWVAR